MTDTSMVVNWTIPDDYFEPGNTQFRICLKKSGSLATPCGDIISQLGLAWQRDYTAPDSTSRSFPVTGLDPNTEYKVKVMCDNCSQRKKHWWQKIFSTATHKLGAGAAKTGDSSATGINASFWASAATPTTITVSWRFFGTAQPSSHLHLCFKERWWPSSLSGCKGGDETGDDAVAITDYLHATSQQITFLEPFTNYIIYLVDNDVILGEVKAQTQHR